jgi:hypothetical protein
MVLRNYRLNLISHYSLHVHLEILLISQCVVCCVQCVVCTVSMDLHSPTHTFTWRKSTPDSLACISQDYSNKCKVSLWELLSVLSTPCPAHSTGGCSRPLKASPVPALLSLTPGRTGWAGTHPPYKCPVLLLISLAPPTHTEKEAAWWNGTEQGWDTMH